MLLEVPVQIITGHRFDPLNPINTAISSKSRKRSADIISDDLRIRAHPTPRMMMTQERTLSPELEALPCFDPWQGPKTIGEWFVLRRDNKEARCEIRTHPSGWELRLTGVLQDGFELTQICRSKREVHDTSEAWKAKLVVKGWQ